MENQDPGENKKETEKKEIESTNDQNKSPDPVQDAKPRISYAAAVCDGKENQSNFKKPSFNQREIMSNVLRELNNSTKKVECIECVEQSCLDLNKKMDTNQIEPEVNKKDEKMEIKMEGDLSVEQVAKQCANPQTNCQINDIEIVTSSNEENAKKTNEENAKKTNEENAKKTNEENAKKTNEENEKKDQTEQKEIDAKLLSNIVSSEFKCPVCQEIIVNATSLKCSHTFCRVCIDEWLEKNQKCPVCRQSIQRNRNSRYHVLPIDNFISLYYLNFMNKEDQTTRARLVNEHRTKEVIVINDSQSPDEEPNFVEPSDHVNLIIEELNVSRNRNRNRRNQRERRRSERLRRLRRLNQIDGLNISDNMSIIEGDLFPSLNPLERAIRESRQDILNRPNHNETVTSNGPSRDVQSEDQVMITVSPSAVRSDLSLIDNSRTSESQMNVDTPILVEIDLVDFENPNESSSRMSTDTTDFYLTRTGPVQKQTTSLGNLTTSIPRRSSNRRRSLSLGSSLFTNRSTTDRATSNSQQPVPTGRSIRRPTSVRSSRGRSGVSSRSNLTISSVLPAPHTSDQRRVRRTSTNRTRGGSTSSSRGRRNHGTNRGRLGSAISRLSPSSTNNATTQTPRRLANRRARLTSERSRIGGTSSSSRRSRERNALNSTRAERRRARRLRRSGINDFVLDRSD